MNIMETMKAITELAKKGMTVELQEKIVELREEVVRLKEENIILKQKVEEYSKGDRCPKCRKHKWKLEYSRPHPQFGEVGGIERTYKCSECGFSEKYIVTPKG